MRLWALVCMLVTVRENPIHLLHYVGVLDAHAHGLWS
jgi:hypothetical protein